ncbi:MAG: hypothetical protein LBR60_05070 [Fibrobacter sp.]|jgi:hypothetical protein|nr:hypothetical protein [Fibrobacter sp.]
MKYLFIFFCLILCACDFTRQESLGYCTPPALSKDTLFFNAPSGTDSVSASYTHWWFSSYGFSENNCEEIYDSNTDYCTANYCSDKGEIMKAECPWFTVIKTSTQSISVSVKQNETGEKRKYGVHISAGNCATGFTITQSAE